MSLTIVGIIGFMTLVLTVLVKVVGLPDQIRKNYKRRSTEGLSSVFFIMGLLTYVLWTIYGILRGDIVVVLGQGVGVIAMGIIVYQIYAYRGKR